MALADIKERIIREAEQEAKKTLAEQEQENVKLLRSVQAEVAREKSRLQTELSEKVKRTVEQGRVLAKMEAAKSLLQTKRELLARLLDETMAEILGSDKLLQSFFAKMLAAARVTIAPGQKLKLEVSAGNEKALKKALEDVKLESEVVPKKDRPAGSLELVLPRSRMNCSLQQFLADEFRSRERTLAEMIFS